MSVRYCTRERERRDRRNDGQKERLTKHFNLPFFVLLFLYLYFLFYHIIIDMIIVNKIIINIITNMMVKISMATIKILVIILLTILMIIMITLLYSSSPAGERRPWRRPRAAHDGGGAASGAALLQAHLSLPRHGLAPGRSNHLVGPLNR